MTEKFERAAFFENLESTFHLRLNGSETLELQLVEVSESRKTRLQEMFSVVFRGRSGGVLPQKIYRLEHEKMGQLDLFLVPISQEGQEVCYEAVFNLVFKESESSSAAS